MSAASGVEYFDSGEIAFQVSTERLNQRQPHFGEPLNVLFLLLAQGHELRLLVVVQNGEHVERNPRQERRVVPALLRVDVAHVLKAEVVGNLAGRQKRIAAEFAR